MMEEGSREDLGGGVPPAMDESWWAAVMEEEERHASTYRPTFEEEERRVTRQGNPEDWVWAQELYQDDDVVELMVIGYNRGGLLVEARNLRGFVPVSHLIDVDPTSIM